MHLHPKAEQKIFDLIHETSSNGNPQVFISTHSEVFVDEINSNNIIKVKRGSGTELRSIDESEIDGLLASLGYGKSDLLQSEAVVFVEGRSDQEILKVLSKTLSEHSNSYHSFGELGVTVRPLKGDRMKKHGEELSNLLGQMRTPHLFVADSDDQNPEDKAEQLRDAVESGNVEVLSKYCIESYLLKMPNAIGSAFSWDIEKVGEFIAENKERPNGKEVMKDLFKEFTDGMKPYDETEHGWMIARHANPDEIPDELVELIAEIRGMAQ